MMVGLGLGLGLGEVSGDLQAPTAPTPPAPPGKPTLSKTKITKPGHPSEGKLTGRNPEFPKNRGNQI